MIAFVATDYAPRCPVKEIDVNYSL